MDAQADNYSSLIRYLVLAIELTITSAVLNMLHDDDYYYYHRSIFFF